jgi:hypothetical protein
MDSGVGMPAVAEAIAHDIGRSTAGRGSDPAEGERGSHKKVLEGFHRSSPDVS